MLDQGCRWNGYRRSRRSRLATVGVLSVPEDPWHVPRTALIVLVTDRELGADRAPIALVDVVRRTRIGWACEALGAYGCRASLDEPAGHSWNGYDNPEDQGDGGKSHAAGLRAGSDQRAVGAALSQPCALIAWTSLLWISEARASIHCVMPVSSACPSCGWAFARALPAGVS